MKIYFSPTFVETKRDTEDLWVKLNNGNVLQAYFEGVDLSNANINVRLVIEWSTGVTTNELPMVKSFTKEYVYLTLPTLRESGVAKFVLRIYNNQTLMQTAIFTRNILDSIDASDDTNINSDEYQGILKAVDDVSNDIVQLGTEVDKKQQKLVSGQNIKTINGVSILGNDNIELDNLKGDVIKVGDNLSGKTLVFNTNYLGKQLQSEAINTIQFGNDFRIVKTFISDNIEIYFQSLQDNTYNVKLFGEDTGWIYPEYTLPKNSKLVISYISEDVENNYYRWQNVIYVKNEVIRQEKLKEELANHTVNLTEQLNQVQNDLEETKNNLNETENELSNVKYTLNSSYYTKSATDTEINNKIKDAVDSLVNGAGSALDTLSELSKALGDDPNFATTVSTNLSQKANKTDVEQLSINVNSLESKVNELMGEGEPLRVKDNLRGQTIYFNTDLPFSNKNYEFSTITFENGYFLEAPDNDSLALLDENDSLITSFYSDGEWQMESYTFPDDQDYIIKNIVEALGSEGFINKYISYTPFEKDTSGLDERVNALETKVDNSLAEAVLEIGANLRGQTIYFNTDKTIADSLMIGFVDGNSVVNYILVITPDMVYLMTQENDIIDTFYSEGSWVKDSYTFPNNNDFIILMAMDMTTEAPTSIDVVKEYIIPKMGSLPLRLVTIENIIETKLAEGEGQLKIGDNLRGKKIGFDTTTSPATDGIEFSLLLQDAEGNAENTRIISLASVDDATMMILMTPSGDVLDMFYVNGWIKNTYTFSDDRDYIISGVYDAYLSQSLSIDLVNKYINYYSGTLVKRIEKLENKLKDIETNIIGVIEGES